MIFFFYVFFDLGNFLILGDRIGYFMAIVKDFLGDGGVGLFKNW